MGKTNRELNKKIKSGVSKKMSKREFAILPEIKNYSSREEWEITSWQKLLKSKELKELLELFTTAKERHDLVMRIAALDGLNQGKSYRKISEDLWLSPQTISCIKKALKEKNYRTYLSRSKTERKKKKYSSDPDYSSEYGYRGRSTKYGRSHLHL